jgi:acetyl-CoA synthetase
LKPGSATLPFFGIDPVLIDAASGEEVQTKGSLCIRQPWPGMMRTILNDHNRMHQVYFSTFTDKTTGNPLYFTGDGAVKDDDGYLWITGRVDDVIKVSGHRIGSAEVEHALVQHPAVAEAAVIGFPHAIKGEGLFCFVTIKHGVPESDNLKNELKLTVRKMIGPIATPDVVLFAHGLPKTRSGKIMRRILRKIVTLDLDNLGDVSTLADPSVVPEIIAKARDVLASFHQN